MAKLIFDAETRQYVGSVHGGGEVYEGTGIVVQANAVPDDTAYLYLGDDGTLQRDEQAVIAAARAARTLRIKTESRERIEAMDWRLERARERDQAGLTTGAEAEVLAAREAIRRSSDDAEAAVAALTDKAEIAAFTWEVSP